MCSIDELFECILGAVVFVDGEGKIGIVSPADVALEFHYRHQFNGIDAKVPQVIQCVDHGSESACIRKIPDQEFIYNKVGCCRRGER